jgi:hypothetical protein
MRPPSGLSGSPVAARTFVSEPPEQAGDGGVVPTKLMAILQAAVGMLIVQLLLFFLLRGGLTSPTGHAPPVQSVGSRPFVDFVLPAMLAMAWNAAHFAAIYTMMAHATLRWIGWSNAGNYALGGLAAAGVLQAVNALQGAHLTWNDLVVALAGGFTAGYLYRLAAGRLPPTGQA